MNFKKLIFIAVAVLCLLKGGSARAALYQEGVAILTSTGNGVQTVNYFVDYSGSSYTYVYQFNSRFSIGEFEANFQTAYVSSVLTSGNSIISALANLDLTGSFKTNFTLANTSYFSVSTASSTQLQWIIQPAASGSYAFAFTSQYGPVAGTGVLVDGVSGPWGDGAGSGGSALPVPNPPVITLPSVTTGLATNLTTNSATLTGSVNPNGSATAAYFEWGLSTNYGNNTALSLLGSGNSSTNVSSLVSNLAYNVAYHYQLVATNALGTNYGGDLTVTNIVYPVITAQPQSQNALVGATVVFSVAATNPSPFTCQWEHNGTNLIDNGRVAGSASNLLTISNLQTNDSGAYSALVSNTLVATNSQPASLTVYPFTNWPISALTWYQAGYTNDGNYTIAPNGPAQPATNIPCLMSISGGGWTELNSAIAESLLNTSPNTLRAYLYVQSGTLLYYRTPLSQLVWSWSSGQDLDGTYYYSKGTGESNFTVFPSSEHQSYGVGGSSGAGTQDKCLVIYSTCLNPSMAQVELCQDLPGIFGSTCQCEVTVYCREVNQLEIPSITTSPASQMVLPGTNVQFSVTASGSLPLYYQWQFNGTNLSDGGQIYGSHSNLLTVTGIIPNNAGYYQVIVTNVYGSVISSAATLTISNLPDLTPVNINTLFSAQGGLNVTCVVTNQGTGAALGNWYDGIWISTNLVFNEANAINVGNVYLSQNVAAGSNYTWTTAVVVPPAATPQYLFVVADDPKEGVQINELTMANNVSAPLALTTVFPDLAPVSVSAPASTSSGLQVTCVVTNQGPGAVSGNWVDGLWLSTNLVFSEATAVNLGGVTLNHNLPSGSNYTWTTMVAVPQSALPQYLFVAVDDPSDGRQVPELTKMNNTSLPLALATVAPDLAPVSVSAPATGISGTTIQVSCAVTNQGVNTAAGYWSDGIYISSNAVFNTANATALGSVYQNHNVLPGAAYNWTTSVSVPPVPTGTYYIFVVVDDPQDGAQVYELTKANNTSAAISLQVDSPDLTVNNISGPANAVVAQPVQMVFTITNAGSTEAFGPWQNQMLLANNTNGAGAQTLGTFTTTNFLMPGSGLTVTQTVILPAGIIGTRYFGLLVDSGDLVPELNKSNNLVFDTTPVFITGPDLDMEQLSVPANVQYGQNFAVTYAVTNVGGAPATANWNDQIYLSSSTNSLSGATLLASAPGSSPLAPGQGYTVIRTVAVPLTTGSAPGNFYIIAVANANSAQLELTATNNQLATAVAFTLPPLPDLVAGGVTSPASAIAGQVVPVSWAVTNIGAAAAMGPWQETVYLLPASATLSQFSTHPAAYPLIGSFIYTNNLAPGGSISRTQQVTLPLTGLAGNLQVGVYVNPASNLVEASMSNNAALAQDGIEVPLTLSLNVPVTSVLENTINPNISCQVLRDGDLSQAINISLTSSATNALAVPTVITIPAGVATAPFVATVLNNGLSGPNVLATLVAGANGYNSATSQVTIVDNNLPGLTLALASSDVTMGESISATVTSTTTNSQPVVVALASSSSTALSLPPSVTIPVNSNSVSFTVSAVQNSIIAPDQNYTLSVSAPGYTGSAAELTVLNDNIPTLSLSLNTTNINEADGPFAAVGTISYQPVSSQPLTISLASTNPGAALVPAQVTIPALESSATFYVSAVNDTNQIGPKETLISAQALDIEGDPVGNPAAEALTIQDNNGPVLRVSLASLVVPKGANPATMGTVWTITPPTNDLVVTLASSDTNEATVSDTVTIPAGQTNIAFDIVSMADGVSLTSHVLSITASATNYASASGVLTVSDVVLPDLVVQNVTAPAAAYTGQSLTVGFDLANQGLGSLTNGVTQYVYLTTNLVSGTYILAGTAYFAGPLDPGQSVSQSVVAPGSALPLSGTYWIVVTANANNSAPELNIANNNAISPSPVIVAPEYSAMVRAGTTNALMGTPIPLYGFATMTAGGPAAGVPVNILVTVHGLQRIVSVTTDANGNFTTVFNPLANESGLYTISAVLPGITAASAQGEFNILGMSASPSSVALSMIAGGSAATGVTLNNLSDVPLTGLTATVIGLAANLTASAILETNYLGGQSTLTLSLTVSSSDSSIEQSSFTVQLASAEGVTLNVPVSISVNPLEPQLVVTPSQLRTSMLEGGQSVVQFSVVNIGGAASGPLSVAVPSVPWMSVASASPMPSLNPGQSNLVTLALTPGTNLALGPYSGTLAVNGTNTGVQIPFSFDAVSDAHGSLLIQSVDELTFFATNAPPLTNASVTLTDPFSGAVVASGMTDSNGLFFAPGLMAGTYALAVAANQHSSFNGAALVAAGETNTIQAFLSLQTVTYTWTVVPTQVQVQNQITIQATFQTDVPAPVIVPTPASLDLSSLTQPGQYIDVPLTLANEGLIGVQNVAINLSSSDLYEFDIVTTNIGNLAAHSSVTVPMRVIYLGNSSGNSALGVKSALGQTIAGVKNPIVQSGSTGPCTPSLAYSYSYECGPYAVGSGLQIAVLNAQNDCGTTPAPSSGTSVTVQPGNGWTGPYLGEGTWHGPPNYTTPATCDPCLQKRLIAIVLCGVDIIDIPDDVLNCLKDIASCTLGLSDCVSNISNNGPSAPGFIDCYNDVVGCVVDGLECGGKKLGPIGKVYQAVNCLSSICTACDGLPGHDGLCGSETPVTQTDALVNKLVSQGNDVQTVIAPYLYFFGSSTWLSVTDTNALQNLLNAFDDDIQTNSDDGVFITTNEQNALLALPLPSPIASSDVDALVSRWNLTMSNYASGIFQANQVPSGGSIEFIDFLQWANLCQAAGQVIQTYQNEGYTDPGSAWSTTEGAILASAQGSSGTCAQVTIQLDQTAVLTFNAFHATLQLNNGGSDLLTNISANVVIRNQAGDDVTSLFDIQSPVLSGGLNAVDGSGLLAPSQSGSAQWTLIPTAAAAPQTSTNYLVSGTLSYIENGLTVIIPLSPEPITVQPSPQVYLNYFIQHDVYADDPFTPQIEPSIPFAMAVMVQNQGYGIANNFQITSAQPTIVDNQKGLDIGFQIIGSQVDGQPASPSLTANFGSLLPNQTGIGIWYMTSTLDGQFTGIQATYKAVDPLGNPTISFIDGIQTHIMTHLVQAPGSWDDGLPDFLVNDVPNPQNLPDTVYLSSGQVEPISVVQTGSTSGPVSPNNLQVQFTGTFPAGFTYILIPDPANGQFTLTNIVGSDGTSLLTNDFWMTGQTFQGITQPPLLQTNLHLFVYHTNAGPDTYTLQYGAPLNFVNTNPPVSAVYSLPVQSPATFGVIWSGAPYAGGAPIAYYDIYVSDDGGPFTDWQSQITGTSALYNGANGHTYAFYSIATDTTGNRQPVPAQPEAETTVGINTNPPSISIVSSVTLNAGQTLSLKASGSDSNPSSILTFSLATGAPVGATVNPNTGQITWQTSPLFGGTTNPISVIVSDNSQPPLTATGTVSIVLLQVQYPPVLAPISNQTVYEAQILTVTNSAIDDNVPPRPLTFSLGTGAPTNATIDSVTGLFQWQPTESQARSTNIITVIVSDDGNPPLSAEQSFVVIVRPAFELTLSLGSTNVVVGATSSVPITLQSSLQLTNLAAVINVPSFYLTNLALQPVSPEVLSTLLQPLGTNRYAIRFSLNPGLSPGPLRTLAQLGFVATSQTNSAVVLLQMPQLSALQNNGQIAPKPGAFGGTVFVIGNTPLLNAWLTTNLQRMLTLYATPGPNYEIDYSTNLLDGDWQMGWQFLMTNTFAPFSISGQFPQVFYRAFEMPTNSSMELKSPVPAN